jgi:hypothetical protein
MAFTGFPNNERGAMGAPGFSETSAFMAVLEQKSFTRAAKQFGLSLARRGHQATVIHCQLQSLVGSLLGSLGRAMVFVA